MTRFTNIFSNEFQVKDQQIAGFENKIADLEAIIEGLRQEITRVQIEKSDLSQSQQVVISALEQAERAMQVLAAHRNEGLDIFKAEMSAILEADYTDIETVQPIAYLEASVESVEVEQEEPVITPPPASEEQDIEEDTEAIETILDAVEEIAEPTTEQEEVTEAKATENVSPTVEEVAKMKREDVKQWLDKLDVQYDTKTTLANLRAKLNIALMANNLQRKSTN